ncbi:LacI family DNA-binding transcriptional regulator [Streptosporangium saharense]|uniref:LacI family DNA-binding transcriptional regulator n=1 Tax=Streptosporangium saharense TaxID=1706840 RepID=UPI003EBA80AE
MTDRPHRRPATGGSRSRPTMKDVAASAGVALKTVSRVVNGERGVNALTAERVRSAIERLGYRRDESARGLRGGRTSSVGLVIEDVADPFYSGVSRAVEDVALGYGSLLLSGSSGEDPRRERELVLTFCSRRVDGLIIVPAGADHEYLRPELDAGTPAVFADRPGGLEADTVICDNAGGACAGVTHLLRYGHRRVAFIGDNASIFTAAERLRGYRRARAEAGLPADDSLVATGPPERAGAALARMLAAQAPPTALFTGNGRVTLAVLRTGQRLPMVGFDDFELADLLVPGVSVVAQDPAGLGRTAAELLFRRIQGDPGPAEHVELPTRLIPRGSGELPPS